MQLPVNTLLGGLLNDLANAGEGQARAEPLEADDGLVLGDPDSAVGLAAARVLAVDLARQQGRGARAAGRPGRDGDAAPA